MRAMCNISYVAQVENLAGDEKKLQRWELELNTPTGETARPRSHVDPGLLEMMKPGGAK